VLIKKGRTPLRDRFQQARRLDRGKWEIVYRPPWRIWSEGSGTEDWAEKKKIRRGKGHIGLSNNYSLSEKKRVEKPNGLASRTEGFIGHGLGRKNLIGKHHWRLSLP